MFAQRYRALPFAYLLLAALAFGSGAASGQPATNTTPPSSPTHAAEDALGPRPKPSTGARAQANSAGGPTAEESGRLHVVLFKDDGTAAAGARVLLSNGVGGTTDSTGSLILTLPAGRYMMDLRLLRDQLPRTVNGVVIVSGKTSEVIATLLPNYAVDADIMLPQGADADSEKVAKKTDQPEVPPGVLLGKVVGAEDQAPVADASVFVAGQEVEAKTSAEGTFQLELPAGAHTLSVIHPKFSTQTVRGVEIKSKETANIAVELTPVAIELQDFVVTAPHISGGVASMIEERKNSATVSDAIGAEDIAKLPANDAAQAAQRVVGATIVGGRFVYVRGLGERYSNALLNGAPLPSPEPDQATVPLDLFPAQILQSLDISKTFTPDMPGNFAGGSVRISTKEAPEDGLFALSLGTSFNTQSTFKQSWGQPASSTDFLGFDDGMRAIPASVPEDFALARSRELSRSDLEEAAQDFDSPLYPERKRNWPNLNGSIAAGDSWQLTDDVRVGVLGSLIYRRTQSYRDETFNTYEVTDRVEVLQEYASEATGDGVRWGAFASGYIALGEDHKLTLLGMHSQLADATTRVLGGPNYARSGGADLRTIRMDYAARSLTFGQLQGEHKFPMLNNAELDWRGSLARAARAEDDTRDTVFVRGFGRDEWGFLLDNTSGRHFYSEQAEDARVVGLDWKQPITEEGLTTSVKAGSLLSFKSRDFRARNFQLAPTDRVCGPTFHPIGCVNAIFNADSFADGISVNETTRRDGDAYQAGLDVYGFYGMAEIGFWDMVKVIGGLRFEQTEQSLDTIDQFTDERLDEFSSKLSQLDLLPGAAIVVSPAEGFNIRGAISRTIARPQLRELSPQVYYEYFGGPPVYGNQSLELTRITNGDLRVEYFPSTREVLAASVFIKDFTDPIEPYLEPSSSETGFGKTFRNTPGATLYGIELEARLGLEHIEESLDPFSVITSLMLAESNIEVDTAVQANGIPFVTSTERPLVQASPWVINASIDYDDDESGIQVRALYYVAGRSLVGVGALQLPDVYLHPRHLLDLTASKTIGDHFKLKASIRNILNSEFVTTLGKDRGGSVVAKYRDGVNFGLSVSYSE